MPIQNEDELKMELKKAEDHLKNLKAKDEDEQDNHAIYMAEIEVRRLKNLLDGNEKQEDIDTTALVRETFEGKNPKEREALAAEQGTAPAKQDTKQDTKDDKSNKSDTNTKKETDK